MTSPDGPGVVISLRDVYDGQQRLSERVTDSISGLNLTLLGIRNHLERVDERNLAADQLHTALQAADKAQSDRIAALEAERRDQISVAQYRRRARASLIAAIGAAAAALGSLAAAAEIALHH